MISRFPQISLDFCTVLPLRQCKNANIVGNSESEQTNDVFQRRLEVPALDEVASLAKNAVAGDRLQFHRQPLHHRKEPQSCGISWVRGWEKVAVGKEDYQGEEVDGEGMGIIELKPQGVPSDGRFMHEVF